MRKHLFIVFVALLLILSFSIISFALDDSSHSDTHSNFPKPLNEYHDKHMTSIFDIIVHRVKVEPFNLVALLIFLCAIAHSFMSSWLLKLSHKLKKEFLENNTSNSSGEIIMPIRVGVLHFLGEIEVVFGLWAVALGIAISIFYDWNTFVKYVGGLHYTEAMFVIVIMTIASSRPILKMFELIMWKIVKLLGGTLEAWWIVILTVGPLLGSFITEPAAMIISAYLLSDKFYDLNPPPKLKYSTLALLFVNVSVGGTLSNFAAPPVLMVSGPWNWDFKFMFLNIGWKAVIGILITNTLYYFIFKNELHGLKEAYAKNRFKKYIQRKFIDYERLQEELDYIELDINNKLGFTDEFLKVTSKLKDTIYLEAKAKLSSEEMQDYEIDNVLAQRFETIKIEEMKRTIPGLLPRDLRPPYRDPNWDKRDAKTPGWMMVMHVLFMIWTVFNAHEPVLFIGGFLFFLGFAQVTAMHQNRINLKPSFLVAFFLAGLIIHGGVQGWWIAPLLGSLSEIPLNIAAIVLTSFNDNAAITYLSTLVPNLSDSLKYAVVTGAVTGGGLTIIANAPNPAGQSILKKYFKNGISPVSLIASAFIPTIIMAVCFFIL